jgi:hypothetical protein
MVFESSTEVLNNQPWTDSTQMQSRPAVLHSKENNHFWHIYDAAAAYKEDKKYLELGQGHPNHSVIFESGATTRTTRLVHRTV